MAVDATQTKPAMPSTPRKPHALGLRILTGVVFLTAFILQRVGPEKSWIPNGTGDNESFSFGPSILSSYNIAAFVFLVLGVFCLLATLRCHANRWKPGACRLLPLSYPCSPDPGGFVRGGRSLARTARGSD